MKLQKENKLIRANKLDEKSIIDLSTCRGQINDKFILYFFNKGLVWFEFINFNN